MLPIRMATSVAMEAGSWMSVVRMKVSSATVTVKRATMRMLRRAPVSLRIRRCPTVTRPKIIRATALPMDAMADRSNAMTSNRIAAAPTSRPTDARSASLRPMNVRELPGGCEVLG